MLGRESTRSSTVICARSTACSFATVNRDYLAGDLPGTWRGQEKDCGGDVFRGTGALGARGFDQCVASSVGENVTEEFGVGDVAGRNNVRGDSVWTQFGSQVDVPGCDSSFGRAVGACTFVCGDGSDGDDAAAGG